MGRKSKQQLAQEAEEREAQVNAEDSDLENAVDLEVEAHEEKNGNVSDWLNKATANISSAVTPKPLSRNQKYKLGKKARDEDFSTIVVTLITLGLSAWTYPEELKPNGDEVNAFSVPATRILLRHVPITGKLSADALDIIGIVAALSGYYARTGRVWSKYREEQRAKEAALIAENYDPQTRDTSKDDGFAFPVPPVITQAVQG